MPAVDRLHSFVHLFNVKSAITCLVEISACMKISCLKLNPDKTETDAGEQEEVL